MTRDEAADWIRGRPKQFAGWTVDGVLAHVQSHTDPTYYDPTLFAPDGPEHPAVKAAAPAPHLAAPKPAAPKPAATLATMVPAAPAGVPKKFWIIGGAIATAIALRKKIAKAMSAA